MILAVTLTELMPILSLVLGGGFVTALVAIYKARPERDSVVVTTTQNAAAILRGLNEALYTDLARARQERDLAERRADVYENTLRRAGIPVPLIEDPSSPETKV